MSWLNYTTYSTYTPMGDSEERALIRQAMHRGASRQEQAAGFAQSARVASKLASFFHIAGKPLQQSHA
jgi:hypothetical protein